MRKEEKQLLLKDLCARLPYEVIVDNPYSAGGAWDTVIDIDICAKTVTLLYDGRVFSIDDVKPYLRPMSSMTEEEYEDLCNSCTWLWFKDDLRTVTHGDYKCYDWLTKKMFDFRGLIPMGLALEAPKDMYKTD